MAQKSELEIECDKMLEKYKKHFKVDFTYPITFGGSNEEWIAIFEKCIAENKPFEFYYPFDQDVIY